MISLAEQTRKFPKIQCDESEANWQWRTTKTVTIPDKTGDEQYALLSLSADDASWTKPNTSCLMASRSMKYDCEMANYLRCTYVQLPFSAKQSPDKIPQRKWNSGIRRGRQRPLVRSYFRKASDVSTKLLLPDSIMSCWLSKNRRNLIIIMSDHVSLDVRPGMYRFSCDSASDVLRQHGIYAGKMNPSMILDLFLTSTTLAK